MKIRSTSRSMALPWSTILVLGLLCTMVWNDAAAQVGINANGDNPDASAILDVKSTEKGLLIPRMSTTQRTSINSPANGLMVFDLTTKSFWFYDQTTTSWKEISMQGGGQDLSIANDVLSLSGSAATVDLSIYDNDKTTIVQDADNDTKIQVEETADDDVIRFDINGVEHLKLRRGANGSAILDVLNNDNSVFIGQDAGKLNSSGQWNLPKVLASPAKSPMAVFHCPLEFNLPAS